MKRLLLLSLSVACVDAKPTLGPAIQQPTTTEPGEPGSVTPPAEIECDPVANIGCEGARSCTYTPELNKASCAVLSAELEVEEPCNPGLFECGASLACTALPKDEESTCYAVCDPATRVGCENVPGGSPTYTCMQLDGLAYGVCVGSGIECNPNADPCDDDETCSLLGGRAVCVPSGEAVLGGDCSRERCAKGAVCVNMAGDRYPRCYAPCDTSAGFCGAEEVCTGLVGQAFGVCQASVTRCDPLVNECPEGLTCSMDGTHVSCREIGPVQIGDDCSVEGCARGGVCAKMLGESPRCFEACDLDLPTCGDPSLECSSVGLSFGLCT